MKPVPLSVKPVATPTVMLVGEIDVSESPFPLVPPETTSVPDCDPVAPVLSVAVTVNGYEPEEVGVPFMTNSVETPDIGTICIPGGSEPPVRPTVYGAVPPETGQFTVVGVETVMEVGILQFTVTLASAGETIMPAIAAATRSTIESLRRDVILSIPL